MLTLVGLLASGVVAAAPVHYTVDVMAIEDNRLVANSRLPAETGQVSQLTQEGSGQRLNVKVTPKAGDGGAVKLYLSVEMSAEGGTVTRQTSMDVSLDGERNFTVEVPAEGHQPAAHFEFSVEPDPS
jgi:hypothetical protein